MHLPHDLLGPRRPSAPPRLRSPPSPHAHDDPPFSREMSRRLHIPFCSCKKAVKLRRPQRTRCGRTTQNAPAYPESQMICLMITNVTLNCSFGISGTRYAGGFRLAVLALVGCSSFRQRRAATTAVRSHHCRCVNRVPFVRCDTYKSSKHPSAAFIGCSLLFVAVRVVSICHLTKILGTLIDCIDKELHKDKLLT